MNYLLDTNVCIALINGAPAVVRERLSSSTAAGARIFVSCIALLELWYGVAKSAKPDFNRRRLEAFLAGPISVLPFDEPDSAAAGSLRSSLERSGKPIGAYDLVIAGQALRHGITLVTSNVSEFSRIKGLNWQDWANT